MKYYTPVTRMSCSRSYVFVRETADIDSSLIDDPDNEQIIIPESSIPIILESSEEFITLVNMLPQRYFYVSNIVHNQENKSKNNNMVYLIITRTVMNIIKSCNLEIEIVTFKVSGQWHNKNIEKQDSPWLIVDKNQHMYYRVPLIHGSLENIMLYKLSR